MKDEVDGQKRLADVEIFARFPRLKAQPTLFQPELKLSEPFRHYRFMVPPEMIADRNIAFAGFMSSISNPINAHIQGLWISAYFDNSLHRLPSSIGDIQWETMLHTRFLKWRYPLGYGAKLPDFVFDGVPYLDMLLGDLGLQKYRKSSPIWELFSPYGPEDYKDLVTEWKSKQRHLEKGSLSG